MDTRNPRSAGTVSGTGAVIPESTCNCSRCRLAALHSRLVQIAPAPVDDQVIAAAVEVGEIILSDRAYCSALNDLHRRITEEAIGTTGLELGKRLQAIAHELEALILYRCEECQHKTVAG